MTRRSPRLRRRLGAVLVAALVGGACRGGPEAVDVSDRVFELERDQLAMVEPVDPDRVDVLPAEQLRLVLQELLAEHAALSIQAMRAAADGSADLPTAVDALIANTDGLTGAIGLVYGPTGARAFDELWTQHIQFFLDYATARGAGDEQAADEARTHLSHYALDFSSFTRTATDGGAPGEVVLELLHEHVDQLLQQVDEWVDGRTDDALATASEAQRHLDVVAAALAGAIAAQHPDAFPGWALGDEVERGAARHLSVTELAQALAVANRSVGADHEEDALDAAGRAAAAADAATGVATWSRLRTVVVDGDDAAADALGAVLVQRTGVTDPEPLLAALGALVDDLRAHRRALAGDAPDLAAAQDLERTLRQRAHDVAAALDTG